MRKIIVFTIIVLTIIALASNNAFDYTLKTALYYGVNYDRAILIAKTIQEEYEQFPSVPYQIFVALIVSESGFKNLYGDNNHAVGYLQLHKEAAWYVWHFFPELKVDYNKLILFPTIQIRTGYRYLYLIMKNITNNNIIDSLNFWNGNRNYYKRIFEVLIYIETVVLD